MKIDQISLVLQVDAAVVKFKLKQPAHYPPVSSTKSFFSMVVLYFHMQYILFRIYHVESCHELKAT